MDKNMKNITNMQHVMTKIQNSKELYVVMSALTSMPFVYCDKETYDDEIFLYFSQEDANQGAKWLIEEKNPIQLIKIERKDSLDFFTSLYPIGVNAIAVNYNLPGAVLIQLNELIRRKSELPEGNIRIENPELHLTVLYLAQELRKRPAAEQMPEHLQELDEEMRAHLRRGQYLVALDDEGSIPILQKDGKSYQPIFTDSREFQKFNRENRFKGGVVAFEKITEFMIPQAEGIVVNPFGANVILQMKRK